MIQMFPSESFAALDTWPSVHPFGICGQDGSTTNFGTSTLDTWLGGAAEVRCDPVITKAATTAKTIPALTHNSRLMVITRILLFISFQIFPALSCLNL